ncbi:MAG TPA: PAS domain-containing protein [Rhodothermales bacterium]|nr:PAS domain-containing protein [Rhodothermales bacterium]
MRDSDLDRPGQDLDAEVLKRALHAINNLVVVTDPRLPDNPIVWVNDFFCEFTGYTRAEVIGRNCRFLQGEDRDQPVRRELRQRIDANEHAHVLIRNYRKDGTLFFNDLYVSPVFADDGSGPIYFVGIQNDVTDREQAFRDVADREREINETAENEQERFGMDLHDGLGQTIAGTRMLLAMLGARVRAEAPGLVADVARLDGLLQQVGDEARAMARGLNPVDAAPEGLTEALRSLADAANSAGGPRVRVIAEPLLFTDRRQTRHLYRIAQEALQNALKHADATTVTVTLHRTGRATLLEVRDDGMGLATPHDAHTDGAAHDGVAHDGAGTDGADGAAATMKRRGMGVHGMRYRADLIGARLTVTPGATGGTVVTCVLPHDAQPVAQHRRTSER